MRDKCFIPFICLSILLTIFAIRPENIEPSKFEDVNGLFEAALKEGPLSIGETKEFMYQLAKFVFQHHLKDDKNSEQCGMIYEYVDMTRLGHFDQFVQGEALDTMHDGAWFAAALVNAYRATGNGFYKSFLTDWVLPFYLKMLNHSDKIFTAKYVYIRQDKQEIWERWRKGEWGLREGEKGFVPYWWDDGNSVSLERRYDENPLPPFPCFDFYLHNNLPNPEFRLRGYSLGSSNHMAQDLGVMLLLAWALMKDGEEEMDAKLAKELAEGAKNLHQCRLNHFGHIPMCCAPYGLANSDAKELKILPDPNDLAYFMPNNHYSRALYDFPKDQKRPFPTFADDQQYRYYWGIAKYFGKLVKPLAFKVIYDAYTERLLYHYYSDDAPVPPGINISEAGHYAQNGKLVDYRSDRSFGGRPRPFGSRMGPQNMICCGWALQILQEYPGIWEEPYKSSSLENYLRVYIHDPPPNKPDLRAQVTPINLGKVTLNMVGTRHAFIVDGTAKDDEIYFKLFSRPNGAGTYAAIKLRRDGSVEALNHLGETIKTKHEILPMPGGFFFRIELPYTVVKDQKLWVNGIEYGRYSIQFLDKIFNFFLSSSEEQVRLWLEWELGYGLRVFWKIFDNFGYIPCEIGGREHFGRFSDSGGYAHLISACSQWMLYLTGKRDWQIHNLGLVK